MPFHQKVVKKADKNGNLQIVTTIDPDTGKSIPLTEPETFLPCFLSDTKEEADALYAKFLPTLKLIANKYAAYSNLDSEDFIEEGLIGLARASRDFQTDRSSNFEGFAIQKIKDAMREFSFSQSSNVSIPQYVRNTSRLIHNLQNLLQHAGVSNKDLSDYKQIWNQSNVCSEESEIIKEITEIRRLLKDLAARSGTTVERLIEKAEFYPTNAPNIEISSINNDVSMISNEWIEDDIVQQLMAEVSIEKIKDLITPEEFDILHHHFVEGKTVRELGPEYGITAATMTIRIHKIVDKIKEKVKSRQSLNE